MPLILWFPAAFFYLWWLSWEVWYPKYKWVVLEIKPPKEILKPFRAMEDIYSGLWGVIDTPNWREKWCEGEVELGGGLWFSFEVVSLGGNIHFYLRIKEEFRDTAESVIYAQYPDAEITEVEDYAKNVPQDLPNKDWNLYAEDYQFSKEDPYPIKTYSKFFEERPEVAKEEKRIDPMDALLEGLSKVTPDEQLWLQIGCIPLLDRLMPKRWITRGKEIRDELAKRPKAKKPKPMIEEAVDVLLVGPSTEKEVKDPFASAVEFRLTPGEKDTLAAIENKISKHGYSCWIRMVHIFKADKPHLRGRQYTMRSYFQQFMTESLNSINYLGVTRTRIHYVFPKRRLFMRKRRQFRNYIKRVPPYYPKMTGEPSSFLKLELLGESKGPGLGKGTMVLNIEELATIFHFPTKIIVPGVPYVEAKKAGPPQDLPTE
ncbi:MAG: hypothetical protein G01um101430_625 [Parcubacteria group bacterium Gr01-1014_30]|nr:MAG: hypothetical protein G01um101430_625 [Parcubacteria group bacterium Gr01-1014_30]